MLIKLKFQFPEIVIGVLLAVAIFAMGMVFESSRHPPSNNQTQTQTNSSGAEVAPNYIPDKITDWLLVLLNLFLVGSTLLLWKANNRSAKIAERALTELERAFVFVKEIDVLVDRPQTIGEIYQVRASAIWENSGRSPAVRMAYSFSCEKIDADKIAMFNFPDGDINRGILGPGAILQTASKRIEPQDFARIQNETERWFIWGWVDYDDVLENTPRHRTEFCFEIKIRPMASGVPFVSFPMHDRFNAADKDCERPPKPFPPAKKTT